MNFDKKLIDKLNKINLEIDKKKIDKFYLYMNLLLKWNEKINLTAIVDEDEIILKHFIDSASVLKYIDNNESLIDIGTGAGFPGIPLKIMKDDLDVTLMDSLNKRITFLEEVIENLSLKNIKAIHSRAEDLARKTNYREKYDIAVSRAVANLNTLLEYMMPFVKIGGKCICMKGANIDEELSNAKNVVRELGGKIIKVDDFTLPDSDYKRNIIIIQKINKINPKYPRKAGIPSKEPLK